MTLGRLEVAPRAATAYDHVRATLRAGVLDGTLAGGARLVQTELAAALGVSTTPVREALRDLAKEGLVIFDAHKGALVRPLNFSEVREIYELRIALEPLMVARVIDQLTAEQLGRAEELRTKMEGETDTGAWVNLNRDFHAIFSEPDKGSRLADILGNLRDSAAPYVALSLNARPAQTDQANCEHAEMLDMYRQRDQAAVVRLTVQHLESTLVVIEEAHAKGVL
ncbi:GntR family transcriptional regulator [Georgenia soli]|uniref:GntR family transcriptional regulator n=1 Tax=Georgenia soli TaxID=638953 RepID=A0A2A9EJP6_9MICO|nr:GntR family transcriptional regulator [Georgenia soli]PFG39043.1 GntR family transcriptional regulator [Georgenia soli]